MKPIRQLPIWSAAASRLGHSLLLNRDWAVVAPVWISATGTRRQWRVTRLAGLRYVSEFPGAEGFPRVQGKNHSKDPFRGYRCALETHKGEHSVFFQPDDGPISLTRSTAGQGLRRASSAYGSSFEVGAFGASVDAATGALILFASSVNSLGSI